MERVKSFVRAVVGRPREVTDQEILAVTRRCLLARGAAVPASEIARELGVSHTTLFNRFGSKEGLLLAALGPPAHVPWVDALEAGPDDRPLKEQLVEHAARMSTYFADLQAGFGILQAAGIAPAPRPHGPSEGPARAFRALVDWLARAQSQGRLAPCDVETLASTLLTGLQGRAFTARVCGASSPPGNGDRYVAGFIDLLWEGIGPRAAPGA